MCYLTGMTFVSLTKLARNIDLSYCFQSRLQKEFETGCVDMPISNGKYWVDN
jgi:hypothetical protein